ncbi:hypothetical protein [Pontimicrobium sp. MEBiC01747]
MKKVIIALIVLISIQAQAQIKLEVGSQLGYEYNYFKSPNTVRFDNTILTENDLISNSIYQDITVNFEKKFKWRDSKLRLIVVPEARLFYENIDDSYWQILGQAKYYKDLSKTIELLADADIKRMHRTGLDGAQDVLINPLGYTNLGASVGLQFKVLKNNKTTTKLFYNFRDFDAFGMRDLQFNEMGVSLSTRQNMEINNNRYKVGLRGFYKIRKYDTFNATNLIPNGKRDWSYLKLNPYLDIPLSNTFNIKPSYIYYERFDKIDRSGFTQHGPELQLNYDSKNTEIKADVSYSTRNYKSIDARNNNGLIGEKLTYKYTQFNITAAHKITRNLSLTATVYSRIRNTNYTDISARSFRGYRNQYAGIGLKWKL